MAVDNKVKIYDADAFPKTLYPICHHYQSTPIIMLLLYGDSILVMNYDHTLLKFLISFVHL